MAASDQVIEYLEESEFLDEDMEYLRSKISNEKFLGYIADSSCHVMYGRCLEGTPIFPGGL